VSIIQEIVNREGWESGNALALWWDDHDDRSSHTTNCRRIAASWDNTTYAAPALYVEYSTATIPTVTTQAVSNIGTTTATGNGNITDIGGENCTKRGVCWNTTGNPTIADDKSEETDSFGTGAFTRPMTGLTPGQHYYVKAYAYNSEGYGYGGQVEFYTNKACTGSDTGSGVDAYSGVIGISSSEVGEGVEALGDRDLFTTEEGLAEDLAALLGERIRADFGMGMDALISFLTSVSKFGVDAGVGVDAVTLKALFDRLDTASGIEAIISRAIVKAETGVGLDEKISGASALSLLGFG
ncbi:unnamed protein product, partial [marine sediment metagenome]